MNLENLISLLHAKHIQSDYQGGISTKVILTRFTPDPVMAAEEAASMCYKSEPSLNGRIIAQCYKNGHHSVLEHVNVSFRIEGVSRVLLAQLTRHRLISFSVESQRYVSYKSGFQFVTPPTIESNEQARQIFESAMIRDLADYTRLCLLGIPQEDARFVLPNAACCSLIGTFNLREFIHLCNERLCARAQWEIRKLVRCMVHEFNMATDNAFKDMLVPKCEKDKKHPYCTESEKDTCGMHPRLNDVYQVPDDWEPTVGKDQVVSNE